MNGVVALRRAILGLARSVGAFAVIRKSRWRNKRLLILAYHGISIRDEHEWDRALYMPQEIFRERMDMLRQQRCSVLPLDEALRRLYDDNLPPRSVTITFDDGTRDFALRAIPILEEYGLAATVYLT